MTPGRFRCGRCFGSRRTPVISGSIVDFLSPAFEPFRKCNKPIWQRGEKVMKSDIIPYQPLWPKHLGPWQLISSVILSPRSRIECCLLVHADAVGTLSLQTSVYSEAHTVQPCLYLVLVLRLSVDSTDTTATITLIWIFNVSQSHLSLRFQSGNIGNLRTQTVDGLERFGGD